MENRTPLAERNIRTGHSAAPMLSLDSREQAHIFRFSPSRTRPGRLCRRCRFPSHLPPAPARGQARRCSYFCGRYKQVVLGCGREREDELPLCCLDTRWTSSRFKFKSWYPRTPTVRPPARYSRCVLFSVANSPEHLENLKISYHHDFEEDKNTRARATDGQLAEKRASAVL